MENDELGSAIERAEALRQRMVATLAYFEVDIQLARKARLSNNPVKVQAALDLLEHQFKSLTGKPSS